MEKHRAIPEGYMTVGEMAKKAGITTRTLRFYDKEGLLTPSSESEGGYRLYTSKDMVRLIQIITMKQLGLTIGEIKNRLVSLDTPNDMVNALDEHAASIREKIESLSNSLAVIEALKVEVLQIEKMDFQKYSDILLNLQMKNEYYWMIKHIDDETIENLRANFEGDTASVVAVFEQITFMHGEAKRLEQEGVAPDSSEGKAFAQKYWELMQSITNGDSVLLAKLTETAEESSVFSQDYDFISLAMESYFTKTNKDGGIENESD